MKKARFYSQQYNHFYEIEQIFHTKKKTWNLTKLSNKQKKATWNLTNLFSTHNTEGRQCEFCKVGFFQDPELQINHPEICKRNFLSLNFNLLFHTIYSVTNRITHFYNLNLKKLFISIVTFDLKQLPFMKISLKSFFNY